MKARNLMIAVLLLTAGSFTMGSYAQENIKALIKKIENMDVIEADIFRNNDPNRKNISISWLQLSQPAREARSLTTIDGDTIHLRDTVIMAIATRARVTSGDEKVITARPIPRNQTLSYERIGNPVITNADRLRARAIINLTIKYTPALEKELVTAFHQDRATAIQEVEQKKQGKVTQMHYRFNDSQYSFSIKNDTISISAVEEGSSNP
jgi:hypothetical protein